MNGYPHLDNKAECAPHFITLHHFQRASQFCCRYSFNERASDIMTTGNLIVLVLYYNCVSVPFLIIAPVFLPQPMRGNTVGSIEQLLRAYRFQGDVTRAPLHCSANLLLL
jgi:hypothetical protein